MNAAIANRRLLNQHIAAPGLRRPADVVSWFGAVQAQEYDPARWALGLRMTEGSLDADIARACDDGRILRTHVMRPTWHFVTPKDIRWLLELTAPRVHRVMASYNRRLGLDARTLTRGASIIERALRDRQYLTRGELRERLRDGGLPLDTTALAHLVMYAELEGVICSGPRRGKQFTYGLIAERAPKALRRSRDEAVAALVRRFFRGHGPATTRDFAWWSGLTAADARRGLEMVRGRREDHDGLTYWTVGPARRPAPRADAVDLLPIYDEYLNAHRDRVAVPHGPSVIPSRAREAITFQHAVVISGQVAGMWRIARSARNVRVDVVPLRRLTGPERRALAGAVSRYSRFLGVPATLAVR